MAQVRLEMVFPLNLYSKEIRYHIVKFLLKENVYSQYINFNGRCMMKTRKAYLIQPKYIFNISEAIKIIDWNQISAAWISYMEENYKGFLKNNKK